MEVEEKYEVIGELELDAEGNIVKLERHWFQQGYIYKNPNAYFDDKSAVCYVPELSDSLYTGAGLLGYVQWTTGNLQTTYLDAVDWQNPETYAG